MSSNTRPRIVIIGVGFAGLFAARKLMKHDVDILLVDRNNFHTFTPLLYQVATCALDPSEIAYPIRGIFRGKSNVRFLLGNVTNIDYTNKQIIVSAEGRTESLSYDYLLIATGTVTNYFGNKTIQQQSFGLKDLQDTVRLRNHVLKLFERAAWAKDSAEREALTTLVVVGGGATGIETAGALYELYNYVLSQEYHRHNTIKARVVLVEATDSLLLSYPSNLQKAALRQLEGLGVEVILGQAVKRVHNDHIILDNDDIIRTYTLIWAAGVTVSPIVEALDVGLQRGKRIPVKPTMEVIGRDAIYAAGDITYLPDPDGNLYPQTIPVAQQQGGLAAKNILSRIRSEPETDFVFRDKGMMATIGRRRAVAYIYNRIQMTGYPAWIAWLFLHLIWLIGFRNRMNVLVNWIWNYLTSDRSVRIILEHYRKQDDPAEPMAQPIADSDVLTNA